jgi:hypothetical protein
MIKRQSKRPPTGKLVEGKVRKIGPEAALKKYAIQKLNESGLLWWRNQSGAVRVQYGNGKSYMVRMGTPGLPDLMLFDANGRLFCVELKSPKGKLRPEQKVFFDRVDEYIGDHVNIFVARSEKEIDAIVSAATSLTYIDDREYRK